MKQNFWPWWNTDKNVSRIPMKTIPKNYFMEIKSCRNWKLSELQEWSVIASTTNDDIVDFQKMPKMTEMTPYDLLTSNMGMFEDKN